MLRKVTITGMVDLDSYDPIERQSQARVAYDMVFDALMNAGVENIEIEGLDD